MSKKKIKNGNGHTKRDRKNISAEDFVRTWQGSTSLADVCAKLGYKGLGAATRAANYRKKGIALKKFPSNRAGLDVAKLKELAKSLS